MMNLLKIEWLKIKSYKTFWVLTTLFLVSIVGLNYFVFYIKQGISQGSAQANVLIGSPFDFPNVWHTVSYFSSFLLFIPGLMIITSITNEYSFKTHRQNIIDGWSRLQFIHVKITLIIIISFLSAIFVFITAILFGFIAGSTFNIENIEFIGYYFIQALSYCLLALLIGILIKRSGLAIGLFFLYSFIIENFLGAILNNMGGVRRNDGPGDYLPLNTVDNLISFPFFRNIVKFGTPPNLYVLLGLSVVYLCLYYFISVKRFQTQDL
ncbi:MAG: ABC transporter permease [Bacteroidota bacterium]|nr:ABC transporter permease [Bacteroidota bacterium]